LNVDLQIRNFVVSHKFVIKFPQRAYQALKMRDASCDLFWVCRSSITFK